MSIVKACFLFPRVDNDGGDLSAEIGEARLAVFDRFDAWTYEGEAVGAYRMPDRSKAEDLSPRYVPFLDDARIGELIEILLAFKKRTTQEKIVLELQYKVDLRLL